MKRLLMSALPALLLVAIASALLAGCQEEDNAPANGTPAATTDGDGGEPPQGVSATEIKLGTHLPLSQTPAAAYAPIADGMRAYFNYINDTEGGVYGRKITLLVGDDHYRASDTLEVVRKLVEQDKVFGIVAGLGESTHFNVWKYLEERNIPDLFISSGIKEWTDPVVRTRFGGNPVYVTEGKMLGQYIAANYPDAKIGLLVQNNEFGEQGEDGIRAGIEGSAVEVVAVEKYEEANFDVTAQTQRLQNAGADVLVAYALPPQAGSLAKTARETLSWNAPIFVSGVNVSDIFIYLAGGAANAEGVTSVVFGRQVYETDQPGVKKLYEVFDRYGVDVNNIAAYGYIIGELTVEGLKRAGPDLTVDSLVDGLESMRGYACSLCLAPVSFSPTDHRPFEIEVYTKVEDGKWVAFGEPVNFESTP
jgi:ABC-type branched-subunit amino acid transport system substrate-binding protein